MTNRNRRNDAEVTAALTSSAGNIQNAAQELGISRQALHERLAKKPWLNPKRQYSRLREAPLHLETLMLCAAHGEKWSIKKLLKLSETQFAEKQPRKFNFSDGDIEDLFVFMRAEEGVYIYHRDKLMKERNSHSLSGRRRIIEIAAALALNILPKEVWPLFCSEWVKLQNLKTANAEFRARKRGLNQP